MSKLDDYLEYEGAFLELSEKKETIDKKCESALGEVNDRMDYYENQKHNLRQRLDNLIKQLDMVKKQSFLIRSQFDDEKRNLERDFDQKYDNKFVSISFRDFQEELSKICDIPLEKIDVKFDFEYPIFSFRESNSSYDIVKSYIEQFNSSHIIQYDFDSLFRIYVDFDYENSGFTLLSLNSLFDEDKNGKAFIEHCSPYTYDNERYRYRSRVMIDKDVDDIMINISFKDLADDFCNQIGISDDEVKAILKKIFLNALEKGNDKIKKIN